MEKVGVLFDLDGVLIDSEGIYTEFWRDVEKVYPTHVEDFVYKIKGNALFKILDTYFEKNVHQNIVEMVHEFERNIKYPIYDGVISFLAELKQRGIPAAIVTSSDDVKMENLYKQYPDFRGNFAAVITGSDVAQSKPHPEGYLLAAKAIGVAPENCYVFEDSLQGLDAGIASGATVVGLTTSNPVEVIKNKAHEIIDDFVGYSVDKMLLIKR